MVALQGIIMADINFAGGVNELNDQTASLEECIIGENFELAIGNTQLIPRNSFSVDVTHSSGTSIDGIVQLIEKDQTETTIVMSGTDVSTWDGTSLSNVGSVTVGGKFLSETWQLDDLSIITDLNLVNPIKQWDGTAIADLTTGLADPLYAKYAIVHNQRTWVFNIISGVGGASVTPHLIAASQFENTNVFDPGTRAGNAGFTGNEAFFLTSPDLKPINGVFVFLDEIGFSTEDGRLWKISGGDSTDYTVIPLYLGSGAVGDRSYANIGNDVAYMRKNGVIELLNSVEGSGDDKTNDISLKIPNQVGGLNGATVIYDERRQKVFFFVLNKVLVLFKELIPTGLSPWVVYKTAHPNNFNATSAAYIRQPGTTDYHVYFGDSTGNLCRMDATSDGDASTYDVLTKRKIPIIPTKGGRAIRGRIVYRRTNQVPLTITVEYGEELNESSCTMTLKGDTANVKNYYNDAVHYSNGRYYKSGLLLGTAPVSQGFSPAGRGSAAFITLTSNTNRTFVVDKMVINDDAIGN